MFRRSKAKTETAHSDCFDSTYYNKRSDWDISVYTNICTIEI